MLVLDSSAVIEVIRGTELGENVLSLVKNTQVAITSFTIHEIMVIKDSKALELLRSFHVFDYGFEDALESAKIENELKLKGSLVNQVDIFIAGICRRNGFKLLTSDKGFLKINGLDVELLC